MVVTERAENVLESDLNGNPAVQGYGKDWITVYKNKMLNVMG